MAHARSPQYEYDEVRRQFADTIRRSFPLLSWEHLKQLLAWAYQDVLREMESQHLLTNSELRTVTGLSRPSHLDFMSRSAEPKPDVGNGLCRILLLLEDGTQVSSEEVARQLGSATDARALGPRQTKRAILLLAKMGLLMPSERGGVQASTTSPDSLVLRMLAVVSAAGDNGITRADLRAKIWQCDPDATLTPVLDSLVDLLVREDRIHDADGVLRLGRRDGGAGVDTKPLPTPDMLDMIVRTVRRIAHELLHHRREAQHLVTYSVPVADREAAVAVSREMRETLVEIAKRNVQPNAGTRMVFVFASTDDAADIKTWA